ncbi:SusC/RagA family TonB-linked outer membrane protein [Niabella aurantiaca]|uniref:SusC/RagA family TonB-linked outer membrane protein n=1 Tax=Niabella aurantiaca TaxID=379900 RepID=UPI000380F667|nr:TonB-dependent receptor [Niabella aurantiaca]
MSLGLKFDRKKGVPSFAVKLFFIGLLCCFSAGVAHAAVTNTVKDTSDTRVAGRVTDASGDPMVGVSIQVKEGAAHKGTVTNKEGRFVLNDVPLGATLVVSYVGYQTMEIAAEETEMNIVLQDELKELEETVVVGYGRQKKKLVTGATVEIKGDDIKSRATLSPLAAIQGQSPGVSITSTGGNPGAGFNINIRGAGTVGSTTPLFLVDGVQVSDISYLNASDIASIDILKDAASTAIYGARAANGIIIVTTKTGKAGFSQVSFDGFYGIQNPSRKLKVLNATDYMNMMDEMYVNSGWTSLYTDPSLRQQLLSDASGGTDWIGLLLAKNVPVKNYSVNVQGGTKTSVYSISLSMFEQGGIVGGPDLSNFRRTTFTVNTEHKLYKDILVAGQHLTYVNSKSTGGNYTIRNAIRTPSILPNMDKDHPSEYYYNNTAADGGDNVYGLWSTEITNPYALMMHGGNSVNNSNKLIGDVYFDINLRPDLKFRSSLGIEYLAGRGRNYNPGYPDLSANTNASTSVSAVNQSSDESLSQLLENTLTYTPKVEKGHHFNVLLGTSARKYNYEYLGASNKNLLYEGFDYAWLDNASGTSTSGSMGMRSYPSEDKLFSYFGRVNYDYKGKIMATAIVRSDGSSRFDRDHRRGVFPSFSAGWNISNEGFLQGVNWVDYLKVRASWGQNGNMNIPAYYYLALVNYSYPYAFGPDGNQAVGSALTNRGNPGLGWEKSQSSSVGLDARFLRNRLSLTFDVYNKTTKDWLVSQNLPDVYGVSQTYINGGNVVNKGIELLLSYAANAGKDFTYAVSGNVAFNKNRVSDIPTDDGILHGGAHTLYDGSVEATRSQDGYPLGYFWGYQTSGVFQSADEVSNYKNKDGIIIQPNAKPGDLIYVDRNGDGVINALDKDIIGNGRPDAIFGLTVNLGYKAFDFSVVANGVAGNQILQNYIDPNRNFWNITQDIYDGRWHGEGTSNRYPKIDAQMSNWVNFSDAFLYSGSYLKINTVTLGYDFARSVIKKRNLSQLRLYVTAQNLYNFTSYNGMDPEIGTGSNGVDNSEVGRDTGLYPHARTFLLGLNVKF